MNKDISALFDIINSIDDYIAGRGTAGTDSKQVVSNFISQIENILSFKPELANQLTTEQKNELEAGLNRGKAFIS